MVKIETKRFYIEVEDDKQHGYFEHHVHGGDYGGGLWFKGKELVDYDGVFELPKEVITALREAGYDPSYAE